MNYHPHSGSPIASSSYRFNLQQRFFVYTGAVVLFVAAGAIAASRERCHRVRLLFWSDRIIREIRIVNIR